MAGSRIAHATLKGPSVVKEIVIGIVLGCAAGSLWKMHHWNEQRKVRAFYDLLDKGEITVIEKLKLSELTCRQGVTEVAKIIYGVHDDESNRQHQKVPDDLLEEAKSAAKAALEEMDAD